MLELLKLPPEVRERAIKPLMARMLKPKDRMRRNAKWGRKGRRTVGWGMDLTPEEWIQFRDKALLAKLSMAELVRKLLGLGSANRGGVEHGSAVHGIRPTSRATSLGNAKAPTPMNPDQR